MKPATLSGLLGVVCVAQLLLIVWLFRHRTAPPAISANATVASADKSPVRAEAAPPVSSPVQADAAQVELAKRYQALEAELAAAKQELAAQKSQITVPYGPPRTAGRFVGRTFRKMFETAAAQDPAEAREKTAENQISVLSLGPFIQMAESIEGDPALFAQFQGSLVGEVLGIPEQQSGDLEALLADLSTRALKVETGSHEWAQLNDLAVQRITAMLPDDQKQAMQGRLDFFQRYGVLMIPAYSILRAPSPIVVELAAPGAGASSGK